MRNNKIEIIKVACLIVIALSLVVIAWNTFVQVNLLQEIQESLNQIGNKISRLKDN